MTPPRNRRLLPGEWSARRRGLHLPPSQGAGPLTEWAVEVAFPLVGLVAGVVLLGLVLFL
jgi:hypothetical protein